MLTRDAGKLSALARAARKSRRRFGGGLGPFQVSRVVLGSRAGRELWTLSSASAVTLYPELSADMVALAHASYGTEVVRELLPAETAEPEIFELLVQLYEVLARNGPHPPVLRAFELHLLRHVGLEPVLDRCAACGAGAFELASGAVFDPARGGAVCRDCAASSVGLGVRPLGAEARHLLSHCAACASLADAVAIASDAEGSGEARSLIMGMVQSQIGRPLKSLEFARKLR